MLRDQRSSPPSSEPQIPLAAVSAVETQATALRVLIADKGTGIRGLESSLGDVLIPPGGVGPVGKASHLARVPSVMLQMGAVREQAQDLVVALAEVSEAMLVRPLGAAAAITSLKAVQTALTRGAQGLGTVLRGLDTVQVAANHVAYVQGTNVIAYIICLRISFIFDEPHAPLTIGYSLMRGHSLGGCFLVGSKAGGGRRLPRASGHLTRRVEQHNEPGV